MGFTPTLSDSRNQPTHQSDDIGDEVTVIAGYRAVRRLADSGRATIFLGRAPDGSEEIALKIAPHDERSAAEIHAIGAMDSPHIPALVDVASTDPETLCVVEPYLEGVSLRDLIAIGPSLSTAQWATLAIGIARGVQHAHERGYAHGSLDAGHVLIQKDGTPVIVGWGSATALASGAGRSRLTTSKRIQHESVADDTADVETLLIALAQLVRADDRRQAVTLAEIPSVPVDSRISRLEAWEKTVFARTDPQEVESLVARLTEPAWELQAPRALRAPSPDETRRSRRTTRARGRGLRSLMQHLEPKPWTSRRTVNRDSRVGEAIRGIRIRTWVLLAVAIGCAALTIFLLGARGHGDATEHASSPRRSASSSAPTPGGRSQPDAPGNAREDSDADLVNTTERLLRDRHTCLAGGYRGCISRTDESGSPLAGADRDAIDAGTTAENDREFLALRVTAKNGDSVTIAADVDGNDKPASILMMRTEAGWRLRSVSVAH